MKFIVRNYWSSTGIVHGLGPRRGPWTRSTGVVHGPGVHVLYMFLCKSVKNKLDEQTVVFILAVDPDKYKKESSQILQKLSFVTILLAMLL